MWSFVNLTSVNLWRIIETAQVGQGWWHVFGGVYAQHAEQTA